MNRVRKYKGVIFDFNGVLIFDSRLHEQAWDEIAREVRGTAFSPVELAEHMHGRTNRAILQYLLGREPAAHEIADLVNRKESRYRALCLEDPSFALSPGAIALLDVLGAKRQPTTIATSSEKTNLEFFIWRLELDRWFDPARIVYDDGLAPGKPAPDIYRRAADKLRLLPADCVVIEDSLSGIQSANDAGIGRIYGLGRGTSGEKLRQLDGVFGVLPTLEAFPREILDDEPFPRG